MSLTLVTAPAAEPITLQEAKDHLRVDGADDDALISALITAARERIDGPYGWLGRAILTQTWDFYLDEFPAGTCIYLPLAPVQSVVSVTYTDPNGASQTFADYALGADLDSQPRLVLGWEKAWPATRAIAEAVKVRFIAGYATPAAVPAPIKAALLLTVGHLYENREAAVERALTETPMGVDHLLSPYRRHWI